METLIWRFVEKKSDSWFLRHFFKAFHYLIIKIILKISFFISSKFTNLPSSHVNIESIERFKVTADIISILNHNNTLQSFDWSSIALNIQISHFENWLFSFVVSLQKVTRRAFQLLQKRWRNEDTSDMPWCHFINGGSLPCFSFKYTSYKKIL